MLWQQCLNKLESELSDQEINTWLRTLHGTQHENILVLLAPNTFVYQHVKDHHIDNIKSKIETLSDSTVQVILQIGAGDIPSSDSHTIVDENIPDLTNRIKTPPPTKPNTAVNQKSFTNNLNTSMTFENFVEGKSNQLAVASAQQVGENPGQSYNPLFIYGGVGLGKTHLMHAIGNKIRENNPNAKVVYLHSERFVNDMVTALRTNSIDQFKIYYRTVDALLIDDIQFFAGKTSSVEEFFHTFNALLEGQKQIILTKDAAFFIAKRFRSNVRDLEGALQRVLASLRLHQRTDITLDFVHDALRDQLASQDKMVTVDNIKKTVAQHYNIKTSDLDSKSRRRSIARPRQVAMSLSKELTNHSLPEIGSYFGGRDHTTVIHACKKIKELRTEDTALEESYRILERTLTR